MSDVMFPPSLLYVILLTLFPRLVILHGIDMDKVANEKAKNSLESHVFETKDAMYSEVVVAVSIEEQREVVTAALNDASDWLDDEGYTAKTKVTNECNFEQPLCASLRMCRWWGSSVALNFPC